MRFGGKDCTCDIFEEMLRGGGGGGGGGLGMELCRLLIMLIWNST